MDSLRLGASRTDNLDEAEALYRSITEAYSSGERGALTIDLSALSFLAADSLMALITAARLWHGWTQEQTTLVGMHPDVHRYLERMDVFTTCGLWLCPDHELPSSRRLSRSSASRKLLEVIPLASDEVENSWDVHGVVQRAQRILDHWFGVDTTAIERLLSVFSEIGSNVVHSRDVGFAVIQHYRAPNTSQLGGRVTIAVADLGIGIEASLRAKSNTRSSRRRAGYRSGSEAILEALALGVTGGDTVRGMGLARVRSIVEDWHGSLTIRSHGSAIRIEGNTAIPYDALTVVPGTQVTIRLRGGSISETDSR